MSLSTRRRLTAWLGLVAMWLIVLAPVVSQLVVEARSNDPANVELCSVMQPAGSMAHDLHDGSSLAACGYCDLLAAHPAVPTVSTPLLLFVVLIVATIVPAPVSRFTPLGAFPSGRPRGPPASSPFSL